MARSRGHDHCPRIAAAAGAPTRVRARLAVERRPMRIPLLIAVLALAASCSPPQQKAAEQPAQAPAQQQATAPVQQAAAVDPQAIAALEHMSGYLRTLQNFEVRANTTTDEVAVDNGQKLQFSGSNLYRVARPHAFFIETQ